MYLLPVQLMAAAAENFRGVLFVLFVVVKLYMKMCDIWQQEISCCHVFENIFTMYKAQDIIVS